MLIKDSLNIKKFPQVISLIGGGGKTTTMYQLARELSNQGKKVLVTTTTHISMPKENEVEEVIVHKQYEVAMKRLKKAFINHPILCLAMEKMQEGKLKGIPKEWVKKINEEGMADVIIVEADGAKRKPFKAPASHEPVLPEESDIIIVIFGIDALEKPITSDYVHRPEKILDILGIEERESQKRLSQEDITKVVFHPRGLLKGVPMDRETFILINKVEENIKKEATALAKNIFKKKKGRNLKVLIGRVQDSKHPILQKLER